MLVHDQQSHVRVKSILQNSCESPRKNSDMNLASVFFLNTQHHHAPGHIYITRKECGDTVASYVCNKY